MWHSQNTLTLNLGKSATRNLDYLIQICTSFLHTFKQKIYKKDKYAMQEDNDFAENENSWETDKEKILKSPILIATIV